MICKNRQRPMAKRSYLEYLWYLPFTRQDGSLQLPADIEQAQQAIARIGTNVRRFRACQGHWVAPNGRLVRDMVIPVRVEVPDRPAAQAAMMSLAAELAANLGQENLLVLAQEVSR